MDATSPLPSAPSDLPEDTALARALDSLVTEGVLTEEQASRVAAARAEEIARSELAHPGAPPPQAPVAVVAPVTPRSGPGAPSRLPEVLGYLGGTFVVAAALLVVGWSWDSFTHETKVTIALASAVVLFAAGLAIALVPAGGRATILSPTQDVRRRLAGVLLVVGAFVAAGAVGLLMEDTQDVQLLPIALTAAVLSAVAVWLTPGVAPTLGLFTATVLLALAPENLRAELTYMVWVLVFLALGALWVGLGPWLTRTPTTALAVGLGDLFVTGWVASEHTLSPNDPLELQYQWGDRVVAPVGYAVLAMLTILGVALYLRGRPWPWLAAATGSAAVLVFQLAGDAFGPAVAALVVGTLLLVASGLLIVRRGRVAAQTESPSEQETVTDPAA